MEICSRVISTYNTVGRREAIVVTCSPLLNRFMIKVSIHYAGNLVGILVDFLGRSAIKLLSLAPLISAARLVYQDLIFDTMPIFFPETMLFLCFSAFQGIERKLDCGFCSLKRHPNLQSLQGMAIVEGFNRYCRCIRNGLLPSDASSYH